MPPTAPPDAAAPILVTGATGYIGGRLVPRLLERGRRVRCLVRQPRKLEPRPWRDHPLLEVVQGDVTEPEGLTEALRGCSAAYYLVHSMQAVGREYRDVDRRAAENFAAAAAAAGLTRIVYLGGLGETGDDLSEHLGSRREVERVLREGAVPVTVLRAAMIVGSGSASFEILRYLVERLPVMITPRWVTTRSQPIAVRNVLGYLVDCLDVPETAGETLDVGGPDVFTYRELMNLMTDARDLPRRLVIPVPVLTPRLSSLWIHLVTPISHRVARPLAEGLRNEVVCQDDRAQQLMPQELMTMREAIEAALARVAEADVETSWSAAGPVPGDPDWSGGDVFRDRWSVLIDAPMETVFRAICRVGGGHGWYAGGWLWRLRGWMDRLVGGPGLRRGRRHPEDVGYGEALDFWRVTDVARPTRLALRAEMKLPGEALLAFDVAPEEAGARADGQGQLVQLLQTAAFRPKGLFGLVYWYSVLPLHGFVFRGMLRGIRRAAEKEAHGGGRPSRYRDPKVRRVEDR